MSPWLEIIIPVRNAGSKLLETAESLVSQTERGFGVLLSDNFSSKDMEILKTFSQRMNSSNIPVRRVSPAYELGRVQHWNWAHGQGMAEWLKPLFVGDMLNPTYVARLRDRIQSKPKAQFVRCEFDTHAGGKVSFTSVPFPQDSLTPEEFLRYFPTFGNWIGGPINVAYSRVAWQSSGGYPVHLAACADLKLNATLALRHGMEIIHERLAVFQLHEQRFSHGIRGRRVNGCFELFLILLQMKNYCGTAKLSWPKHGVLKGVSRQMRGDYWAPFKQRMKKILGYKS
jgi:hypothetical protein